MSGTQKLRIQGWIQDWHDKRIKRHLENKKYKIFRTELEGDLASLEPLEHLEEGERTGKATFFNEPFKEISIQFLEHVRLEVNGGNEQEFKSVNDLYNFILLSTNFDLTEAMADEMFLNRVESFHPLSKLPIKQLCRVLHLELLILSFDKKRNKIYKEFESRSFGINSRKHLILLFDYRGFFIKKINLDRFLYDEKDLEVCINTTKSKCIGEGLTHILPSHLKAVNPELEFVSEEPKIEIKDLLNFTFDQDIYIKNGCFHIFVYEGRLDIVDGRPNRRGIGRRIGDPCQHLEKHWKNFSERCDWVYTIKGDALIPHVLYLNRVGNTFQLFHFRARGYTQINYRTSGKRKRFSTKEAAVIKKMKKVDESSSCLCQNKIASPFLQSPIISRELPFLLQSLGWVSENISNKLDFISMLTIGFFDIEATSNYTPRIFPIIHGLQSSVSVVHTGIIGVQNLCLIGYCDRISKKITNFIKGNAVTSKALLEFLQTNRKMIPKPKVFHIGGQENSECENTLFFRKKLVTEFLLFVHKKAKLAQKIKKILFADILQAISRIEEIQKGVTDNNYYNVYSRITRSITSIINTFFIFGFNSSSYDSPMLMVNLYHLIGETLNSKQIKVFRKGHKIINLQVNIKGIKIIFKDYKFLESPGVSLRTLTKRYNIEQSKGFFPHSINKSLKFLKSQKYMPIKRANWQNIITGECESIENIKEARADYKKGGFKTLYEYFVYYLKMDVLCLDRIFMKYWEYWRFKENFDFVLFRKFTISSLLYNLVFFKTLSSDPLHIAPFYIKSDFYQNLMRKSKLGGITTCAGRGKIGQDSGFQINSHLKNSDVCSISSKFMSFFRLHEGNKKKAAYSYEAPLIDPKDCLLAKHILSYDISSLYASAMLENMPWGPVLLWNNNNGCPLENNYARRQVLFTAQNRTCLHTQEFMALRFFIHKELPLIKGDEEIIQIRTQWSCGGQILFESKARPDLYVVTKIESKIRIYYINFDGAVFHSGHESFCPQSEREPFLFKNLDEEEIMQERRKKYLEQVLRIHPDLSQSVELYFRNITSCEYNLCVSNKDKRDQPIDPYFWMKSNFPKDLRFYDLKRKVLSHEALLDNISKGDMQGFVLLSNFKIAEKDRNPMFGFCIEKQVKNSRELLLGKNFFSKPLFIHTNYFNWLRLKFSTNEDFLISHFFEFFHYPYFKQIITNSVNERANIKTKLKLLYSSTDGDRQEKISVLEATSALLKLKNNGLYGYTMLSPDGYHRQGFYTNIPRRSRTIKPNITPVYIFPVNRIRKKTFFSIIYSVKKDSPDWKMQSYTSLVSIGSCILYRSKVIFFNSILFLLKCLDHTKAELLYWDTDSIMIATHFPTLFENVLNERKSYFEKRKKKYIYLGEASPKCGLLVFEGRSDSIVLLGEKIYQKINNGVRDSKAKSVPYSVIKSTLNEEKGDAFYEGLENTISSVLLSSNFKSQMELNYISKRFTSACNPMKREFRGQHSVTYN